MVIKKVFLSNQKPNPKRNLSKWLSEAVVGGLHFSWGVSVGSRPVSHLPAPHSPLPRPDKFIFYDNERDFVLEAPCQLLFILLLLFFFFLLLFCSTLFSLLVPFGGWSLLPCCNVAMLLLLPVLQHAMCKCNGWGVLCLKRFSDLRVSLKEILNIIFKYLKR